MKNPYAAAALSLVPGLGQLYVGKTKKALAFFCIDAALVFSLFAVRTRTAAFLVAGVYLATAIPAGVEACLAARLGPGFTIDSKAYVVFMLLTTGFSALPLLWQTRYFGRREKIAWTLAVPVLAALFFGALALWL